MQLTYNTEDLVIRAKQKDQLAFKLLYEKSINGMFGVSYRITNNIEDSKDVIQEAYITSFNNLHKLSENRKYFGWLRSIVINRSIEIVKSRVHYQNLDTIDLKVIEIDNTCYDEIPSEVLKNSIQELPDGCREIFTLYLLENYKHREISKLLNIKLSTSKSQYQYALKLLREKLKKHKS